MDLLVTDNEFIRRKREELPTSLHLLPYMAKYKIPWFANTLFGIVCFKKCLYRLGEAGWKVSFL